MVIYPADATSTRRGTSNWCWDEHFLDFFTDKGYHALAPSLRGHDGSPISKRLRKSSIADYVDDVCSVADNLPTAPVLIGHSMGGFIVAVLVVDATGLPRCANFGN